MRNYIPCLGQRGQKTIPGPAAHSLIGHRRKYTPGKVRTGKEEMQRNACNHGFENPTIKVRYRFTDHYDATNCLPSEDNIWSMLQYALHLQRRDLQLDLAPMLIITLSGVH